MHLELTALSTTSTESAIEPPESIGYAGPGSFYASPALLIITMLLHLLVFRLDLLL